MRIPPRIVVRLVVLCLVLGIAAVKTEDECLPDSPTPASSHSTGGGLLTSISECSTALQCLPSVILPEIGSRPPPAFRVRRSTESICACRATGEQGPTLEIFQYNRTKAGPKPAINRPGLAHLAFAVDDVEAARDAVVAAGGGSVGEIVSINVPNAGKVTFVYVTDPEGNIVELQKWDAKGGG